MSAQQVEKYFILDFSCFYGFRCDMKIESNDFLNSRFHLFKMINEKVKYMIEERYITKVLFYFKLFAVQKWHFVDNNLIIK